MYYFQMFKKHNNFLFQPSQPINPFQLKYNKDQLPVLHTSKQRVKNENDNQKYYTQKLNQKISEEDQRNVSFETEDYVSLQIVLSKQVQILQDNIALFRQKNHLKDKQIQNLANNINKLNQKSHNLQTKLAYKQSKLSKISIKCQQLADQAKTQQQKLKRESLILREELQRCNLLNQDINFMQKKLQQYQKQAQSYKTKLLSFDEVQQENQQLKQYLISLEEEQKSLEQEQNYQKNQCIELNQKLKSLKSVYQERAKINNRNLSKLNQIQTQVANITKAKDSISKKQHQIKRLQMQMGDLNQELLLINEQISELDFKIRKKQKNIKELKVKLNEKRHQKSYLTYNAIQENDTPKESYKIVQSEEEEHFQKIATKSIKTSKNNSNSPKPHPIIQNNPKNNSPFIIKTNITPTFTPHEQQKEQSRVKVVQQGQNGEAFKNIQKLISRFEQIKTKQKYKN